MNNNNNDGHPYQQQQQQQQTNNNGMIPISSSIAGNHPTATSTSSTSANSNNHSNEHDDDNNNNVLMSSSYGELSQPHLPFFADAILDLDEAHDIADTPEVTRPRYVGCTDQLIDQNKHKLQVPTLISRQQQQLQSQQQQASTILLPQQVVLSTNPKSNDLAAVATTTTQRTMNGLKQDDYAVRRNSRNFGLEENTKAFQETNFMEEKTATTNNEDDDHGNNNEDVKFQRITSLETDIRYIPPPVRPPRWPRDISWTVAFILFVPISQIYPIMMEKHEVHLSPLTRHPLSTATIHALWWTIVVTVILCPILYRSSGGIDGDDARHFAATILTRAAPAAVVVYILLAIILYFSCPNARWATLIPIWYTIRDVYLFRRWKQRRVTTTTTGPTVRGDSSSNHTVQSVGPGFASRQAFFQALVNMALDILARSLRRESFYRVLTAIIFVQVGVLLLWRWAIQGALGSGSWIVLLIAIIGGKWATGTVARTLTLLASGGVMSWCFQQAAMLDEIELQDNSSSLSTSPDRRKNSIITSNHQNRFASQHNGNLNDDDLLEGDGLHNNGTNGRSNGGDFITTSGINSRVPEAYRTVDASVYHSVLALDDVLDDDYEDEDDEQDVTTQRRRQNFAVPGMPASSTSSSRSTVKAILSIGLAISFGSIAHCGLLGGLAQFIWSQLRKIEAAQFALNERRQERYQREGSRHGFQGMAISGGNTDDKFIYTLWRKLIILARDFVRDHSDLAMTHVAAYYKGYNKAARDVASLIDDSGVEPILHDDITTHMCSCVGSAITGIIVIVTGNLLLHQRKHYADVDDLAIVENMLVAFILCYTLIFTVMEPLRASVKAVYVSFAHCPRSISQAYPIIYHRLCRISESNLT